MWDAENRLTQVRQGPTSLASFAYDGRGQRAQKTTGGVTREYVLDDANVAEERVSTGTTLRYVHGGGIDQHFARQDASTTTYYLADHLGSVVQQTDASGAAVWARKYDPWGKPLVGADAAGWAYTGREWDPEVGLYYYRARYYQAALGRFLSEDPLGGLRGLDNLTYVGNKPERRRDPTGNTWNDVWFCIRYPWSCVTATYPCKEEARKIEMRLTNNQGSDSDRSNAIKHCFWSCCVFRNAAAPWEASFIVMAHESDDWNRPEWACASEQDRHNNRVGMAVAQGYRGTCLTGCSVAKLQCEKRDVDWRECARNPQNK